MSFFSKKQEVSLEEFCRDFYEQIYLNPTTGKVDVSDVYPDTIKHSLTEADDRFDSIDSNKFATEIVNLQFELFALAWLHQFGDKSAVAQSTFTARYLHEKKRDDIWDAMKYYNEAIANSVTAGKHSTKLGQVDLAFIIRMRADLADKYIDHTEKSGIDSDDKTYLESIGRPLNRLFSENAWKKGVVAYFLILALCDRLSFGADFIEPNKEAQFRLSAIIQGIYDGARQALEKIKIKN